MLSLHTSQELLNSKFTIQIQNCFAKFYPLQDRQRTNLSTTCYLSLCFIYQEAQVITEIKTNYEHFYRLRSVACLNDDGIWTRGTDNTMRR